MTDDARATLRSLFLWPIGTNKQWILWLIYPLFVFQLAFLFTGGLLAHLFHVGCEMFKCQK